MSRQMTGKLGQGLKLMAQSRKDLEVISTFLQDAAVKVSDLAWQPGQHRFAAVLNRYRWEQETAAGKSKKKPERVRAGLRFEGVLKASYQNIPMQDPDHVLGLLAIEVEEGDDGAGWLTLACSGYASIRLEVECIEAYLEDLTQPWRALGKPGHTVDEAESDA
jgi:hypothetical protein